MNGGSGGGGGGTAAVTGGFAVFGHSDRAVLNGDGWPGCDTRRLSAVSYKQASAPSGFRVGRM